MGTLSFDGLFPGQRKAQDFIVYPMADQSSRIFIQSDKRFGRIELLDGSGVLSPSTSGHANSVWLQLSILRKTAVAVEIPTAELEMLRAGIRSTGGLLVGESFVKCDNLGAYSV